MIRLRIKDKSYIYDVFHIVKAFFPNETVEQEIDEEQGMFLELEVCVQERICRICAEIKELDAYETKREEAVSGSKITGRLQNIPGNAGVGNPNGDPPDKNRNEDVRRADGERRDSENSHGTISDE